MRPISCLETHISLPPMWVHSLQKLDNSLMHSSAHKITCEGSQPILLYFVRRNLGLTRFNLESVTWNAMVPLADNSCCPIQSSILVFIGVVGCPTTNPLPLTFLLQLEIVISFSLFIKVACGILHMNPLSMPHHKSLLWYHDHYSRSHPIVSCWPSPLINNTFTIRACHLMAIINFD
jgi:hypothetical protein